MKSIGSMEHGKSRRGALASVLLAALGIAWAMPAAAQTVEFNGALVDRSDLPRHQAQLKTFAKKGLVAPASVPSYGNHWSSYTFGPCDASIRSGVNFVADSCAQNRANADGATANIGYPIHLPHGSQAQFVYYWYSDTHTTSNPSAGLWFSDNTGQTTNIASMTPAAFSGGNTSFFSSPFSHTVDNWSNNYSVLMLLDRNGAEEEKFYRGIVFYKLQVAPAPAGATFNDVPTSSPFHRFVEALVDAGTTAGCGGGNYCPNAPVTRAQMAVFLSQVLGLNWAADETPSP